MPKFLIRIVAFLLVPCLMADPALTAGFSKFAPDQPSCSMIQPLFLQEALSPLGEVEPSGELNREPTIFINRGATTLQQTGMAAAEAQGNGKDVSPHQNTAQLYEELQKWLETNGAIEWDGGTRYGRVRGRLKRGNEVYKVSIFPEDAWAREDFGFGWRFPELQALQSNPSSWYTPPAGAFGQIVIYIGNLADGRMAVIIEEIQPGDGYRKLSQTQRKNLNNWRKMAVEKIADWAEEKGLPMYGIHLGVRKKDGAELSEYEIETNYIGPYDPSRWKSAHIVRPRPFGYDGTYESDVWERQPKGVIGDVRKFVEILNPVLQDVFAHPGEHTFSGYPGNCGDASPVVKSLLDKQFGPSVKINLVHGKRYNGTHTWLEIEHNGELYFLSFVEGRYLFWQDEQLRSLWQEDKDAFYNAYKAKGYARAVFEKIEGPDFYTRHHLVRGGTVSEQNYKRDMEEKKFWAYRIEHALAAISPARSHDTLARLNEFNWIGSSPSEWATFYVFFGQEEDAVALGPAATPGLFEILQGKGWGRVDGRRAIAILQSIERASGNNDEAFYRNLRILVDHNQDFGERIGALFELKRLLQEGHDVGPQIFRLALADASEMVRAEAAAVLLGLEEKQIGTFRSWLEKQRLFEKSVVAVRSAKAQGSGFVVAESETHVYLMTASHVVGDSPDVTIIIGAAQKEYAGRVIARYAPSAPKPNQGDDIALIAVRKARLEREDITLAPIRMIDEKTSHKIIGQYVAVASGLYKRVRQGSIVYISDRQITHAYISDVEAGDSGSPLLMRLNDEPVAVGVRVGPFIFHSNVSLAAENGERLFNLLGTAISIQEASGREGMFVTAEPALLAQALRILKQQSTIEPGTLKENTDITAMASFWRVPHLIFDAINQGWFIRTMAAVVESALERSGLVKIETLMRWHSPWAYLQGHGWVAQGSLAHQMALASVLEFFASMKGASYWRHTWEHILRNNPFLARWRENIRNQKFLFDSAA